MWHFKKEDVEAVREVSDKYPPRMIEEITGIDYNTITRIQIDPENNIVNPVRQKVVHKFRRDRKKVKEGYFDIDAYAKENIL